MRTIFFRRMKNKLIALLDSWMPKRKAIVIIYLLLALGTTAVCFLVIGKDMLPKSNAGQLQLRVREPAGTRLEITETAVKDILDIIHAEVNGNVEITSAFVALYLPTTGTAISMYSTVARTKPLSRYN